METIKYSLALLADGQLLVGPRLEILAAFNPTLADNKDDNVCQALSR